VEVIVEQVIKPREGVAYVVSEGQKVRIEELLGGQIVDFVVINANNHRERFSQARTKANQGKIFITKGDRLYSRFNNVMMTITEDTYGIHDLQYGMCSKWVYESSDYKGFSPDLPIGGSLGRPTFGCFEILTNVLSPYGIAPEDIPEPFNIFQTVEIDPKSGSMKIIPGKSRPGDYIELRAEIDCLIGASACPSTGKPFKIVILKD